MGPAAFVIAIMGCADGGSACTAIKTLPVSYRTESACVAATPAALYNGDSYDFPTIVAQCQPRSPAKAASRPQRNVRITDGGRSG